MASDSKPPACAKCNRDLLNLEHGKCMYCGEPLPEAQQLDPSRVDQIRAEKHERWREESNENQWGQQRKERKDIDVEGEWGWTEYLGSDTADGGDGAGDSGGA